MRNEKKKSENIENNVNVSPDVRKKEKQFRHYRHRKEHSEDYIRIEDLEDLMSKQGEDIDLENLVSMYMPHRKRRRIGAALLRMDKMQLFLLVF